jgi:hypothetical protein
MRNTIFNVAILLSQLGSLVICTHNLYVLTKKKKKQSAIVDRSDTVAKALLTNVSIVLTKVSVPAEEGSNIPIMTFSQTSTYNGLLKSSP